MLQPTDHMKLTPHFEVTLKYSRVDLATKNVVEGNQRINCQIQLTVIDYLHKTHQTGGVKLTHIVTVKGTLLRCVHELKISSGS